MYNIYYIVRIYKQYYKDNKTRSNKYNLINGVVFLLVQTVFLYLMVVNINANIELIYHIYSTIIIVDLFVDKKIRSLSET